MLLAARPTYIIGTKKPPRYPCCARSAAPQGGRFLPWGGPAAKNPAVPAAFRRGDAGLACRRGRHGPSLCVLLAADLALQLGRGHVAVVAELREALPQQLVALEGAQALVDLLEHARLGVLLGHDLPDALVAR